MCHKVQYESWKETYHSKMVRKPAEGSSKRLLEKWATDTVPPRGRHGNVTGKPFKNWRRGLRHRFQLSSGT